MSIDETSSPRKLSSLCSFSWNAPYCPADSLNNSFYVGAPNESEFPLPSAIASDSVHDRIISSRLTSTSPRSESPVGTFSPSDDAEPPLAPPSSYAGKQLPPALASSTAAAVNMRRSYSTPTLRPGTLPRHPPPSHPPRVASQGSAPAPPSNAPRAGQGELDIYAYCRPLSASSIKGTDAWRQALADIGIGHYVLVARNAAGETVEFDFGPQGADISLEGTLASSLGTKLAKKEGGPGPAAPPRPNPGLLSLPAGGTAVWDYDNVAAEAVLSVVTPEPDCPPEKLLPNVPREKLKTPPVPGEIRETKIPGLPCHALHVGTTPMTLDDIRAYNRAQPLGYLLHVNDCRHYLNGLVRHLTGREGASSHTIRHYFSSVRGHSLAPHDRVLQGAHVFTDVGNWPVITEAARVAATAAAVATAAPRLAATPLSASLAQFLQDKLTLLLPLLTNSAASQALRKLATTALAPRGVTAIVLNGAQSRVGGEDAKDAATRPPPPGRPPRPPSRLSSTLYLGLEVLRDQALALAAYSTAHMHGAAAYVATMAHRRPRSAGAVGGGADAAGPATAPAPAPALVTSPAPPSPPPPPTRASLVKSSSSALLLLQGGGGTEEGSPSPLTPARSPHLAHSPSTPLFSAAAAPAAPGSLLVRTRSQTPPQLEVAGSEHGAAGRFLGRTASPSALGLFAVGRPGGAVVLGGPGVGGARAVPGGRLLRLGSSGNHLAHCQQMGGDLA